MDDQRHDRNIAPGKSLHRPPEYSSRSVKLRLALLIALLGICIVTMYEAGKSETWERLGFVADPQPVESAVPADEPATALPRHRKDRTTNFWPHLFHGLKASEQQILLQMVDARVRRASFGGDTTAAIRLLQHIENEFRMFADARTDILSGSDINRIDSTIVALRNWLDNTDSSRPPAVDHVAIRDQLRELQIELDACAYGNVEDRTALGRSAERLAWLRSWQKVLAADQKDRNASAANIVHLMGQPDAYRGQFVHIRGTARGIECIEISSDELPFDRYYVLWVKPVEMSRTPYCVYLRGLPDNFPRPQEAFLSIDQPVSITGIFFKLRSYLASNNNIETCPLIVADSPTWLPTASAADRQSTWRPPVWMLALFFVGIPIFAAWLAIGVYRSTKVKPLITGKNDQLNIAENLRAIAQNEKVKSDREQIDELRRQMSEDSGRP